jgi:hypothetical protein
MSPIFFRYVVLDSCIRLFGTALSGTLQVVQVKAGGVVG